VIAFTPSVRVPLAWIPGLAGAIPPLEAIEWNAGLTIQYKDVQFVGFERDPRVRQSPIWRLDATIGFAHPTQRWSLGFVVQNLTDEFSRFRTLQVPLASMVGTLTDLPDPPRLWFVTFRWAF
jgi:hypothetical protein